MVMDGYYGHERLPELWSRINALHLSYLEMDDNLKKLEHRNKLEDCIKEFLCVAPHGQKFCFKETAEVLHRSASSKKDFSGYKAALGWNAIGMYAGNLISQPWRQEYREIKMYSGFYKHQIEANLVGAEIMFEAMGYKHAGNGIMVLEGPICPDRVTNVSQDSLVAYVECQILKEIWEEVCSAFKITWLEVLQFRESHLCGPQKSSEALRYQIQQRQYHEHHRSYSHGNADDYATAASNSNFRYHQQHITSPHYPVANHSFPPLVPALPPMPPPPPPAYAYSNGYNYGGNYGVIPTHYTFPPNMTGYVNNKPYNNYYCNGGYHNIPTGQLIEIGAGNNQGFDVPDAPAPPKSEVMVEQVQKNGKSEAGFENWEYVYRNLESQGYSKDLGERGDLLKSEKRDAVSQYEKPPDRPLKINEALEKLKLIDRKPEAPKASELSSSYENLSAQDLRPQTTKASKTLTSKIKANVIEKLDPKKLKEKKMVKNLVDRWECAACTYFNGNASNICEMCGKSKVMVSHEMEIGGSECSKCTLVNAKDRKVCEACGASLHNSPTYI